MFWYRDKKLVADAILEKEYVILAPHFVLANAFSRKKKQVGQVFSQTFSWPEAIDAAADVYNGVRPKF